MKKILKWALFSILVLIVLSCAGCFKDKNCNHDIVRVLGKKVTCYEDGRADYYQCKKCYKNFKDREATEEIKEEDLEDFIFIKSGHNLTYVPRVEPTCTKDGNIEYYHCNGWCGNNYTSLSADVPLFDNVKLNKLGHEFYNYNFCYVCDYEKGTTLGLAYELVNGTYQVVGIGEVEETDIKIPTRHDGINVTGIKQNAFKNCTQLTSVDLNNTITTIEANAFYGCENLERLTIGEKVITIGSNAFYGCVNLERLEFNAKNCSNFSSSSNVFYNAGTSNDGIELTIGDKVKKIPAYLFKTDLDFSPNITSIAFGEDSECERVSKYAFYGCGNLTNIVLPNSLLYIEDYAFYNCLKLLRIDIPNQVTSIGASAFYNCISLECVIIRESVLNIGNYAFYNCIKLKEIDFDAINCADFASSSDVFYNAGTSGNGVTVCFDGGLKRVPAYMFYGKTNYEPNLNHIGIYSDTCESIGKYAFYNCKNINSIYLGTNLLNIENSAFQNCTKLLDAYIPDSTVSIGKNSFSNCTNLELAYIGDSVKSIGSESFYNCINLKTINFDAINCADFTSSSDVFYNAGTSTQGIKVYFGSKVKKVPAYIFYGKTNYEPNLISVEMSSGSNCESIGKYAFYNCKNLLSVTLSSSLLTIEGYSFYNCLNLQEIIIPYDVVSIGSNVFGGCLSLSRVEFENCYGWIRVDYYTSREISNEDLQSVTLAAQYLKNDYVNYTWTRQ